MLQNNERGLPFFVACDTPYFIDISDTLEIWKHSLKLVKADDINQKMVLIQKKKDQLKLMMGNPTFLDKIQNIKEQLSLLEKEESSLLVKKELLEWLACVERMQSDKGILNPSVFLGKKTMESLKSPDKYQYLPESYLVEIKEYFRKAILESDQKSVISCTASIFEAALEELGMFPEGRLEQAEGCVATAFNDFPGFAARYNADLEDQLKIRFFQAFWQKNLEGGAEYSKAQVADLSKIYCNLVMLLVEPTDKK